MVLSSFEIISVVMPDPKKFFWIGLSLADATAVNPNGIKTLLVNCLSKFSIKEKSIFSNVLRSLPENPPGFPMLESWVFNYFRLADESSLKKSLQSLEICVLVNNDICRKLVSSL